MGDAFAALQTHSECKSTLVEIMFFHFGNQAKTKKSFHGKLKSFCQRNRVKNQKKAFTAFRNSIRPEFVGFFCAARPFFVCSTSTQTLMGDVKSRWGKLNLNGGTLTLVGGRISPCPP